MTTTTPITDLTGQPATAIRPRLGRRISWAELYRQRPDLRPVNDNSDATPQPASIPARRRG
jgi:hypothetical protein